MQEFNNKTLLITGGTGSFGNAVLKRFISSEVREIRVLSRDEKKQDDMRNTYKNKKIKFYLGDVRDYNSISNAVKGVDFIFHAAALKQVPSCEFHPMEATKTNVLGTANLLDAAIFHGVERVVCLSTDKAVYPINAMGISKALMEKVAVAKARNSGKTTISVTRYGNVMASRGSVIPLFSEQLYSGNPITITDPSMTRFMMSLDEAVNLVLFSFKNASGGDIFVQKSPACTIENLVHALAATLNIKKYSKSVIGTRHGEKLYEVLLSREERISAEDLGDYFRVKQDDRDLNYEKFFEQGKVDVSNSIEYTSHNTLRLDIDEMQNVLGQLPYIKLLIKKNNR